MSTYRRPARDRGHDLFHRRACVAGVGDVLVREIGLFARGGAGDEGPSGPSGSRLGWCCRITCIAVWRNARGGKPGVWRSGWGAIKARFTRAVREKYATDEVGCRPGFKPGNAGASRHTITPRTSRSFGRADMPGLKPGPYGVKNANRPCGNGGSGTPHPRRGGLLGACAVLLVEPGETTGSSNGRRSGRSPRCIGMGGMCRGWSWGCPGAATVGWANAFAEGKRLLGGTRCPG